MKTVDKISVAELSNMAEKMYGSLVKADVDVDKKLVVVDMEMHADGEAYLLENGSKQDSLWGLNLHPDKYKTDDFIEFDSMINIRPRQNNPSRDVLNETIRQRLSTIIKEVVYE